MLNLEDMLAASPEGKGKTIKEINKISTEMKKIVVVEILKSPHVDRL